MGRTKSKLSEFIQKIRQTINKDIDLSDFTFDEDGGCKFLVDEKITITIKPQLMRDSLRRFDTVFTARLAHVPDGEPADSALLQQAMAANFQCPADSALPQQETAANFQCPADSALPQQETAANFQCPADSALPQQETAANFQWPADSALLQQAMAANFQWKDTQGATLSLDIESSSLVLTLPIRLNRMKYKDFSAVFHDFINNAKRWMDIVDDMASARGSVRASARASARGSVRGAPTTPYGWLQHKR